MEHPGIQRVERAQRLLYRVSTVKADDGARCLDPVSPRPRPEAVVHHDFDDGVQRLRPGRDMVAHGQQSPSEYPRGCGGSCIIGGSYCFSRGSAITEGERGVRQWWSKKEDDIMRAGWSLGPTALLADLPGRSKSAVKARARILGLRQKYVPITHCPNKHEYSPENTRYGSDGRRTCRTCDRARLKRQRFASASGIAVLPNGMFDSTGLLERIALAIPRRKAA